MEPTTSRNRIVACFSACAGSAAVSRGLEGSELCVEGGDRGPDDGVAQHRPLRFERMDRREELGAVGGHGARA